jgi:hypothetical protein
LNEILTYIVLILIIFTFVGYIFLRYKKNYDDRVNNLIIQLLFLLIAFVSLIISINNLFYSREIKKDMIIPKLQIKPISIEEKFNLTQMEVNILNYSEFTAKNIFLDIKFPDKPWRKELIIAADRDRNEIFIKDRENIEIIESMNKLPTWDELKPGKSVRIYMYDENKEYLSNQKMFYRNSDGTEVPIPFNESIFYKRSQDWQGELKKLDNGNKINILFRIAYSNEIERRFERIVEYQLICTKIGTGKSYTFIPTGLVIEDI